MISYSAYFYLRFDNYSYDLIVIVTVLLWQHIVLTSVPCTPELVKLICPSNIKLQMTFVQKMEHQQHKRDRTN